MFSFFKKKREDSFESKISDLDDVLLSESERKDSKKIEQYVVERLEQMMGAAREVEDETVEYRRVTSYLNDIQTFEEMPEKDKAEVVDTAQSVMQLNAARTEFLNSAKKITDAQFVQMEQREDEIPDAIHRLSGNEAYRDSLRKDMRYLEREKSEWALRGEYLEGQRKSLKNLLYVVVGLAATVAVLLAFLQLFSGMDVRYGWMALALAASLLVCGIYVKIQDDGSEISSAERCRNRAIVLQNRVKMRYVSVETAIEYACEKYHVRNATDLEQQWGHYQEAVREREKYQKTNEDLEYFKGRLIRLLNQYKFYDSQIWLSQAAALVDPKEMVEVKHELVTQRQKLRDQITYNMKLIAEQKSEARQLLDKVGPKMKPQVEQILSAMDHFAESL